MPVRFKTGLVTTSTITSSDMALSGDITFEDVSGTTITATTGFINHQHSSSVYTGGGVSVGGSMVTPLAFVTHLHTSTIVVGTSINLGATSIITTGDVECGSLIATDARITTAYVNHQHSSTIVTGGALTVGAGAGVTGSVTANNIGEWGSVAISLASDGCGSVALTYKHTYAVPPMVLATAENLVGNSSSVVGTLNLGVSARTTTGCVVWGQSLWNSTVTTHWANSTAYGVYWAMPTRGY